VYLAQGLRRRGHFARIICRPDMPLHERAARLGLDVLPIRMRGEFDVWAAKKIARAVKEADAQIVHLHAPHAQSIGLMASVFPGVRTHLIAARRVDFSVRKHALHPTRLKYGKRISRIVAVSHAIKNVLIDDGIPAERIRVVHSGIDLTRHEGARPSPTLRDELGIGPATKLVGAVGALVGHKAHRYLLDAIPKVRAELPDTRFVIAGDGELRPDLEKQARDLKITDCLTFLGFRRDVFEITAALDLFVTSSVEEGLGTSTLDAMALERPVVATDAGGIPEIVHDGVNGRLVARANPTAFAQAIVEMLRDPQTARFLAAEGRRTVVEEFSVEHMVEGTIDVYREVLGL